MERIVINGKFNKSCIKEFTERAEFLYGVSPKSTKEINSFDAVFFIRCTENEIAEWVGANHLRITDNEADLKKLFSGHSAKAGNRAQIFN